MLISIKDIKKVSEENKQIIFDDFKMIISFLLIIPDSPETSYFKNLDLVLDTVRKMGLTGDDNLYMIDILHTSIYYLAVQYQDKLPIRAKNVKSNDQLYKSQEYKDYILNKMVSYFEELYTTIDEMKQNKTIKHHADIVHVLMRIINTLVVNFKEIPVINKTVKLCLTYAGECIKEISSKGDKRRTVRHMKRTIRECYLEDNPKLNKLASSLYTYFDE